MLFQSQFRKLTLILDSPKKTVVDGEVMTTEGRVVQFENFKADVEDKKTIDLLLKHPKYGKSFISVAVEKKADKDKNKGGNAGGGEQDSAIADAMIQKLNGKTKLNTLEKWLAENQEAIDKLIPQEAERVLAAYNEKVKEIV